MKLVISCTLLCASALSAATLVHDYNLTNSLSDLVGSTPLNSDGGTVTPSGYSFLPNQGLNVSSALSSTANYSLLLDFSFQNLTSDRKIVDFANRTADAGLYDLDANLYYLPYFYPLPVRPPVFLSNVPARVIFTRDQATGLVTGYINGAPQFSFIDTTQLAIFSGPDGIIRFFEGDDTSGGLATRISVYNGALTAAEAQTLGGPSLPAAPTPEPATLLLIGTSLAGLLFLKTRT